jgi:putative toxin-antitoxin system antitoxin component (TIGR02293 family)
MPTRKRATQKAGRKSTSPVSAASAQHAGPWQRSVARWLGNRPAQTGSITFDLGSELQLAGEIRKGLPTRVVDEVIQSGLLTAADIYELVLPRRTLAHRKDKEQRLSPEESDRLARVVRILARSEQALGSTEHAASWLRKPNRALAGKCPLELLGSDAGARAVEKVLGRVEHGVFS